MIRNTYRATSGSASGEGASTRDLHEASDPAAKQARLIVQRLQAYPFILVVVWLFAAINRVVEAANGGKEIYGLYMTEQFFASLQGFLNALAYGLSGGVREAIRKDLGRIFPCCLDPESRLMRASAGSAAAAARSPGRLEKQLGNSDSLRVVGGDGGTAEPDPDETGTELSPVRPMRSPAGAAIEDRHDDDDDDAEADGAVRAGHRHPAGAVANPLIAARAAASSPAPAPAAASRDPETDRGARIAAMRAAKPEASFGDEGDDDAAYEDV